MNPDREMMDSVEDIRSMMTDLEGLEPHGQEAGVEDEEGGFTADNKRATADAESRLAASQLAVWGSLLVSRRRQEQLEAQLWADVHMALCHPHPSPPVVDEGGGVACPTCEGTSEGATERTTP